MLLFLPVHFPHFSVPQQLDDVRVCDDDAPHERAEAPICSLYDHQGSTEALLTFLVVPRQQCECPQNTVSVRLHVIFNPLCKLAIPPYSYLTPQ